MTPEQKKENCQLAEKLLSEQSFRKGLVLGSLATVVMTMLWVMLASATGLVIGYMAIALGAVIGYSIQISARGIEDRYAVLAMVLALAGCIAGNILAVVYIEAIDHQMPVMEILSVLTVRAIVDFIVVDFGLIDLAFWILAVSAAGYVAKRRLSRREQLAMFTYKHSPITSADAV